jgi:hypothetical protein
MGYFSRVYTINSAGEIIVVNNFPKGNQDGAKRIDLTSGRYEETTVVEENAGGGGGGGEGGAVPQRTVAGGSSTDPVAKFRDSYQPQTFKVATEDRAAKKVILVVSRFDSAKYQQGGFLATHTKLVQKAALQKFFNPQVAAPLVLGRDTTMDHAATIKGGVFNFSLAGMSMPYPVVQPQHYQQTRSDFTTLAREAVHSVFRPFMLLDEERLAANPGVVPLPTGMHDSWDMIADSFASSLPLPEGPVAQTRKRIDKWLKFYIGSKDEAVMARCHEIYAKFIGFLVNSNHFRRLSEMKAEFVLKELEDLGFAITPEDTLLDYL